MASGKMLFYMWQPARAGFIKDVHFYLDQALRRVLDPFGNIDEEARRHADEWLAARDFDPERDDPGDDYADAYDVEINHSVLVWEMHENLRLSLIAGLFHQWEKQIRDWLCTEIARWDSGKDSRKAIWDLNFPKLFEFLDALGWDMKSHPFYKVLDKYRLLVNVYKHGEGSAFKQLRQEYPEFFVPEKGPDSDLMLRYADYSSLIIHNKNLEELATAIEGFWNAIPEYTSDSDLQKTPQLLFSAGQKDQAGRQPGWDAKLISLIARDAFGGYPRMFEIHGWPERGENMMRKVQSRVVETYGSVERFAEMFKGIAPKE